MGEGAISIIRLSGDEALDIANKIFRGKDLKSVTLDEMNSLWETSKKYD